MREIAVQSASQETGQGRKERTKQDPASQTRLVFHCWSQTTEKTKRTEGSAKDGMLDRRIKLARRTTDRRTRSSRSLLTPIWGLDTRIQGDTPGPDGRIGLTP